MRRLIVLAGLIAAVLPIPAAAQGTGSCAAAFPEATWVTLSTADVAVEASSVPVEQGERFVSEIAAAADSIAADMGAVEATVCLVGEGSAFDATRFSEWGPVFHAALLADDGIVVVDTDQLGRVGATAAYGLAHARLWQESGGAGWPEPLASTIGHWYETRAYGRTELRHAEMRTANMFTVGSQIDWAEGAQVGELAWDPASNESAIGDLIDHAVAAEGEVVLLDADPEHWAQREAAWRDDLRTELTGRRGPTTVWIWGTVIVVALLVVASALAVTGIRARRRMNEPQPTPPPLPGFFEGGDRPAAESAGERR